MSGSAIVVTNSTVNQSVPLMEQPIGQITVGEFAMGIGILSLPFALILLGVIIRAFYNDH